MGAQWHSSAWVEDQAAVAAVIPATPTLTVVDNGDGTATATVASSTAGTTNTIWTQAFDGELGTSTWTNSGNRNGDGDVTLTLDAGHYLGFCRSVNADGNQSSSTGVYFSVTTTTQSILDKILDAAEARIQSLSLSGIASTSIVQKKLLRRRFWEDDNVALPAVFLTPETPLFDAARGTNVRDDIGNRILITCIHADNQEATGEANLVRQTLWYEKIMKAFRNQQLSAVDEVTTMTIQPAPIVDPAAWGENYLASQMVLVAWSREARGI